MSDFLKNVIKLVSGSMLAQLIGVLLIPIITRLYSPDDFGVFQIFTSISSVIIIISCLSYDRAIMLPKNNDDSLNIVVLCLVLVFVTSLITAIIVIVFSEFIVKLLNSPDLIDYLFLLPISVFVGGSYSIMNYWMSKNTRFGTIAKARVSNAVLGKFMQIGITSTSISPFGLIFGYIGGLFVGTSVMLKNSRDSITKKHVISLKTIKNLAVRYKKFPQFTSWSALTNTFSLQIPSFMLAVFYSTSVVGHYSLANQAVNLPMTLVGGAIAQVFFQKISDEKNKSGDVKGIVTEVYKKLISIGIFPTIVLIILGDILFNFVFGSEWIISGTYARILSPWLFLVFIASPLSTLYSVFEKQDIGLYFNIALLLSRVGALYIGGLYGGPIFALMIFSLTGVIFWLWNNYYILSITGIGLKESILLSINDMIIAAVMSIPLIMARYFVSNANYLISIAIFISLVYYFIIIVKDGYLREKISI
jgi:O-antigen/teichoic acid export membrane protein